MHVDPEQPQRGAHQAPAGGARAARARHGREADRNRHRRQPQRRLPAHRAPAQAGGARRVLHAERPAAAPSSDAVRRRRARPPSAAPRASAARAPARAALGRRRRRRSDYAGGDRGRDRGRATRSALAYELGRLDAGGEAGLPVELVESALRRLSVLAGRDEDARRVGIITPPQPLRRRGLRGMAVVLIIDRRRCC